MDKKEYDKVKYEIEHGNLNITHEQCLLFLITNKIGRDEFNEFVEKMDEISKKLDALHAYTHGHIEGHPVFRNTIVTEEEIITSQGWEGQPIVFRKIGEM